MKLSVNGKSVNAQTGAGGYSADAIVIVPPLKPIPNVPPGYREHSRWVDGAGATTMLLTRERT